RRPAGDDGQPVRHAHLCAATGPDRRSGAVLGRSAAPAGRASSGVAGRRGMTGGGRDPLAGNRTAARRTAGTAPGPRTRARGTVRGRGIRGDAPDREPSDRESDRPWRTGHVPSRRADRRRAGTPWHDQVDSSSAMAGTGRLFAARCRGPIRTPTRGIAPRSGQAPAEAVPGVRTRVRGARVTNRGSACGHIAGRTIMAPVVTMRQLLESGVHFGHQTRRWNPKMKRFIFTERNGIYIIDLQKSLSYIDRAYEFVKETVAHGGTILFIGTKKQAQEAIAEQASR